MQSVLTASDVARCCLVSFATVRRWIEEGHLPAYTTASGHHRILPGDFRDFLERNGMLVDEAFFRDLKPEKRILVVSDEPHVLELAARGLRHFDDRFEVSTASDTSQALALAESLCPELVVLDLMMPGVEASQICERIRTKAEATRIRVLAVGAPAERRIVQHAAALGVDDYVERPLIIGELLAKADRLLSME